MTASEQHPLIVKCPLESKDAELEPINQTFLSKGQFVYSKIFHAERLCDGSLVEKEMYELIEVIILMSLSTVVILVSGTVEKHPTVFMQIIVLVVSTTWLLCYCF